jgi:rhodanese-related sulfurtransferase
MHHHQLLYRFTGALVLGLLLASISTAVEYTTDSYDTVLKNLAQGKAVLIDVREVGEWKQGHLADATLIPLSALRKMAKDAEVRDRVVESLPTDKIIYCHCASGVRVITATQILDKFGYKIRPLEAGYGELVEKGFPRAKQP